MVQLTTNLLFSSSQCFLPAIESGQSFGKVVSALSKSKELLSWSPIGWILANWNESQKSYPTADGHRKSTRLEAEVVEQLRKMSKIGTFELLYYFKKLNLL
jgi:hypothetical protein